MRKLTFLGAAMIAAFALSAPASAAEDFDDGDVDASDFAQDMANGGYQEVKEAFERYRQTGTFQEADDEDDDESVALYDTSDDEDDDDESDG